MEIEERLRKKIILEYGSVQGFCEAHGLKYTTVISVLKRGVKNAGVENIIKICSALKISVDALAIGEILPVSDVAKMDGETDIKKIYTALILRISTEDGLTIDGEPLTDIERYTLLDSLELDLEKIRRMHDRERRNRE